VAEPGLDPNGATEKRGARNEAAERLDIDTFIAGLDSPHHSPESRLAWIDLFYRDMQRAERRATVERIEETWGFFSELWGELSGQPDSYAVDRALAELDAEAR
jgi:hypothetical protein